MSLLTDNDSQLIVSCKVEHSRHVSSPGLDRVIKTTPSTSAVACYTIDTHTHVINKSNMSFNRKLRYFTCELLRLCITSTDF